MSRCYDCVYLITTPEGIWCLMKHDFCIVAGENIYPQKCLDFERKGDSGVKK